MALVVALSLLLGACAPAPDNQLRFGLASAPVTLDPRYATDAAATRIDRLLYERLVDFDERLMPVPSLARWQVLSPTHYRFQLDSAPHYFSDGSRLTAADVKATYDFILDAANASPHRASLSLIKRIEVRDARTVDFFLDHADALFPGYLVVGILPAAQMAAGHAFNRRPLGSGPFEFVSWPDDGRLLLRRRRDGQLLSFVRVSDPTVRVLKLLRGEIDMLQNDLSPELVNFLRQRADVVVRRVKGSNFAYLGFNLQDPLVGKLAVRRAIAQAIDRKAIIRYVMGSQARPANALLPPDHWAGAPDLVGYAYNPPAARAALAQLGYGPQHPLHISYKTSTDSFRVRLATVLQSQLRAVGIDVALQSYDWGTFYGDIKAGNFQMYSLAWVGIKTPDIFRYVFYSGSVPPAGANRGRYVDPQTDALIKAAAAAGDLAQQAADYRRLQARLLETLPYVPLWYEDHVFAARRGIEGYHLSLDGNYDGLITVHKGQARDG
jgi:peptide/nickel transport system substrate-binding protein